MLTIWLININVFLDILPKKNLKIVNYSKENVRL